MCGSDRPGCRAIQQSDQMYCDRCGFLWDINDTDPPECKPGAWRVDKPEQVIKVGGPGRAPAPDEERQKIHDILNNEPAP